MLNSKEKLRELGWKKIEAECYCALVEYGEMTASEIAAHIGARQEKVYQPLKLLKSNGYVLFQDENPRRYQAQNPRYVISQERDEFHDETDSILQDLQEAWEMAEEGIPQASEHAWVLSGKEGMKTEHSRLVEEAQEEIIGFDTRLQFSAPYTLDIIENKANNGTNISIIGLKSAEERLTRLSKSGVEITIHDNGGIGTPTFYIADRNKILMNVDNGKATIVFSNKQFAAIMRTEYEERRKEAKPIDHER